MRTSPELERAAVGWRQPFSPRMDFTDPSSLSPLRSVDLPRAPGEPAALNAHWERRPALTVNDVLRISADPTMAFVRFLKDDGLARFHGAWQPTHIEYHIGRGEFERRARLPWPQATAETVVNPLVPPHQLALAQGYEPEGPTTDVPPAALDAAFLEELRRVSGGPRKRP